MTMHGNLLKTYNDNGKTTVNVMVKIDDAKALKIAKNFRLCLAKGTQCTF